MWQAIRKHPRAMLGAILAHLLFVAILVVSFQFSEAPVAPVGEPQEIIEAEAIDEKVIQAELDKIKAAEQRKKDDARKAREAKLKEQRRKEELKKQKAAAAKKLKEQQAAEKKRLAELERKKKEKLAAEKKRQEAERKRKEEEARLAKLEAERKAAEREKAIQAEIARQEAEFLKQQEQERLARQAAAKRQAQLSEIDRYKRLIQEEIARNWNIPATATQDLFCEVKVRFIPSGEVVDVQVIKSSGDPAFDNSVEKAVYRAAPLSVPPVESGLFDEFREVVFEFDPSQRV